MLKQKNSAPVPVEKQVAILYAVTQNILSEVPAASVAAYEQGLYRFLETDSDGLAAMDAIRETGKLEDETQEHLKKALESYTSRFLSER